VIATNGANAHTKDDTSITSDNASSGTATPIHTDSLTTRQNPETRKATLLPMYESTKDTYILRDTTTLITVRCKKEFTSKIDEILTGVPTCHAFLDFIATERLRSMPHKGSKWDKVLKWAESFSRRVDAYSHAISGFTPHSWESARLVWGCCRWLLLVRLPHIFFWRNGLLTLLRWVRTTSRCSRRSSVSWASSAKRSTSF